MTNPPRWGDEPPKHLLEQGSLWVMIAVPSVWAVHFLLCYWIAAVWCAKTAAGTSADGIRLGVGALTVLALAVIALLARHAVKRFNARLLTPKELTEDTEAERTRFLGNAALLLCSLSAIAVVFTATPVLVFDRCY